jgi:hypothetical protein
MENKIQGIVSLRKNPDIMSAWNYYTKNRELFTGPVFVPFLHGLIIFNVSKYNQNIF